MARILIIDDDESMRFLVTSFLERFGHHVFQADDGARGVRSAAELAPDLILLDVEMPILDGHGAIRVLKSVSATAHIPVVVVTSRTDAPTRAAMQCAGCAAFLYKPVDLPLLGQTIGELLNPRR